MKKFGDKIEIKWLTGTKRLAPLEYFARDVASVPACLYLALHDARVGRVQFNSTLPPGVLECRAGGKLLSRLWFE